jgi:hypothetical protein
LPITASWDRKVKDPASFFVHIFSGFPPMMQCSRKHGDSGGNCPPPLFQLNHLASVVISGYEKY